MVLFCLTPCLQKLQQWTIGIVHSKQTLLKDKNDIITKQEKHKTYKTITKQFTSKLQCLLLSYNVPHFCNV